MSKRAPGTGSIIHRGGDRYLVRITAADNKRHTKTIRAKDIDDARAKVDALIRLMSASGTAAVGGLTFRAWAEEWLRRREIEGRSMRSLRTRVHRQLFRAPWVDDLLVNVTRSDVKTHVRTMLAMKSLTERNGQKTLLPRTVDGALSVLRQIFSEAVDDDLIEVNPAKDVTLPRSAKREIVEVRTHLTPDEIRSVLTCTELPERDRFIIAIALGTTMRAGELFNMRLSDLEQRGDRTILHVRLGSKTRKPKSGQERVAVLLGPARDAMARWLEQLPRDKRRNPYQLLFPGPRGGRRFVSDAAEWLRARLAIAGVARHVRFHDLRHTGGTALLNGWFGHALSKEDLQAQMGHATIAQTEHYAPLVEERLLAAANAFDAAAASDQARISPLPSSAGSPALLGLPESSAGRSSSSTRSA